MAYKDVSKIATNTPRQFEKRHKTYYQIINLIKFFGLTSQTLIQDRINSNDGVLVSQERLLGSRFQGSISHTGAAPGPPSAKAAQ